jgi:hypothetical protein
MMDSDVIEVIRMLISRIKSHGTRAWYQKLCFNGNRWYIPLFVRKKCLQEP